MFICVSTQEFLSGYRICFFLFCDSNNLLVCIKVYSLLIDLPVLTKCLLLGADSSHPIHATKNNAIINKGAHQHSQHSDRGASGTAVRLSTQTNRPLTTVPLSFNKERSIILIKLKRGGIIFSINCESHLKKTLTKTILLRIELTQQKLRVLLYPTNV